MSTTSNLTEAMRVLEDYTMREHHTLGWIARVLRTIGRAA